MEIFEKMILKCLRIFFIYQLVLITIIIGTIVVLVRR
jgi:hypothetical protein